MKEIILAGLKGDFFPAVTDTKKNPVLFIHGSFANHTCFRKMGELFSKGGYNCYAISRRGRLNQPPFLAEGLTFDDYLADTLSVIGEINPAPILIGHSLGGLIAMKAAEKLNNIPAMVLINSAPPSMLTAQPIALKYFFPLLPKIFLGKPFKPSDIAVKALALQKLDKEKQDSVVSSLSTESGIVYRQLMMGQVRLSNDLWKIPVLVLGSDRDRIISRGLNKITVKKLSADYKEYSNHGHWLIEEEGIKEMSKYVFQWLDNKI